jgi:ATP-dependent RNA helicase RhlB
VQENAVPQSDTVESVQSAPPEKIKFDTLNLDSSVEQGIDALGFEFCSPIQGQILPHTLAGNDAIGKAQTGTGKTAAFLITIFNDLLSHPEGGRALFG